MSNYQARVSKISKVLSRDQKKVAFIGRTSNGKSTTINAMLRNGILPKGIGLTTNCFLSVHGLDSPDPYILVPVSDGEKDKEVCLLKKYYTFLLCNNYMYHNFHPFTPAAGYLHQSIFVINGLNPLADNPHPKTKLNCQLTQSSSIVFVDCHPVLTRMYTINVHV